MKNEELVGSKVAETLTEQPKLEPSKAGAADALGTGFYTGRGNGVHPRVWFPHPLVTPNSRVFLNICETNGSPQGRFIGDAKMAIFNIAPTNGGFYAWVEIYWSTPLYLRFDVLVDT